MIDYSFQNHLTFSYGGRPFGEKRLGDNVEYHFTKRAQAIDTFDVACRKTADLILDQGEAIGKPVYVLVSGGLDSVAMVKGFKATGRPFKTATYAFTNDDSIHEMEHVNDLVLAEGLDHETLWMDREWLVGTEAHDWFHRTNCFELGTLPLMKLMKHVADLGGLPVFGGGDMDVVKENSTWHFARFESFLSRYWFSERFGVGAFISFFQHTPDMTLSILSEPEVLKAASGNDLLANKVLNELKIVKYKVIHRIWPGLKRRPKFGGTELFHHHIAKTELAWNAERPIKYGETWKVPFTEFVELIRPDERNLIA